MKVVIAAGGTGGHINPALAVAEELRRRNPDTQILFIGTADHMEATLVPKAGFDFATIEISGFQRSFTPYNIKRNLLTLKRLLFVSAQVEKILKPFAPDVVVGFGGYVSGPVVRSAHKLGIPTAIHEQNAFPGKTNIALSRYADAVMLTVMAAEKHMKAKNQPVLTGLPVRDDILQADREIARAQLKLGNKPLIFSTGGSLGAQEINDCMLEVITRMAPENKVVFVHGCGKGGADMIDSLAERGITPEKYPDVQVMEYVYDMATYLAASDLFINRAGASSLSEIEALGVASLLIPSPYVTENHQFHNACALSDNGAAFVIEEKDLTPEKVIALIEDLIANPDRFKEVGKNAKMMSVPDAKMHICDIVESLVKDK